jgi:hypothetical protein
VRSVRIASPEWRGLGWGCYAALIREKEIVIRFPRRPLSGSWANSTLSPDPRESTVGDGGCVGNPFPLYRIRASIRRPIRKRGIPINTRARTATIQPMIFPALGPDCCGGCIGPTCGCGGGAGCGVSLAVPQCGQNFAVESNAWPQF